MTGGEELGVGDPAVGDPDFERFNLAGVAVVAVVAGVSLAWTARVGATALLAGVAAWQALFAVAWALCLRHPGRNAALAVAALAATAADIAVSVWPHSRLGALAAVAALAMPVLFVAQLLRGSSRDRVVESLSGAALLVLAEAALPALMQVRHEFDGRTGADAATAVVTITAGALVVAALADLAAPTPRFDPDVPRGLLGLGVAVVVGAVLGVLTLRHAAGFGAGRGLFLGAALAALGSLFAIGAAFAETAVPLAETGFARRGRPIIAVLLPLSLLAPVALLLSVAIHVG